jgi:adenylate cyclase
MATDQAAKPEVTLEEDDAFEEVYNIQRRNIYILLIILNISVIIVFFFSKL